MRSGRTLFAEPKTGELKDIDVLLLWRLNSQLNDLKITIFRIREVLRDAESKGQLLDGVLRSYFEILMDIVCDVDYLLDELHTIARLEKFDVSPYAKFCELSQKVKRINEMLDIIGYRVSKFDDSGRIRRRPEIYADDIIGREDDMEMIVGMLQGSNDEPDVSFLSIVGVGGLGKTVLAQLVYNDARISATFPFRMWIHVSDEWKWDNITMSLGKILASVTGHKHDQSTLNPDEVQTQLSEQLVGRKFLLVLDDVSLESRHQWLTLVNFLKGAHSGSWVMLTTRSRETARIVGGHTSYNLQGLSEENAIRLFLKMAFGSEQSHTPDDLLKVGREIVQRCASVPQAIKVVGSLLYGQEKEKWLSFLMIVNFHIRGDEEDIMPILELSYHLLELPAKSCFTCCAMFPKNFELKKRNLTSLWMAEGLLVPLCENQSLEDAGEQCFLTLLHRCYFKDIQLDEYGEIISCKIHHLMHDVVQEVANHTVNSSLGNVDIKLHLFRTGSEYAKYIVSKSLSHYLVGGWYQDGKMDQFPLKAFLEKFRRLRKLEWPENSSVLRFLGVEASLKHPIATWGGYPKKMEGSRFPKLIESSASGEGISLIKQVSDSGLGVIEESEVETSLASSLFSLNLHPPLKPSLPSAMTSEDAAHVNPQIVSSFDGLIAEEALLCCTLFPADYEFEKNTLLQLWMATGIFREEPMEKFAGLFFQDCLTKGYFQFTRTILATGEAMYRFRGDRGSLISRGSHTVRIEDSSNLNDASAEVCHVSVTCGNMKGSNFFLFLKDSSN